LDGRSTTDATKVVTIDGGAGNDTITGAAGKDVLVGGEGKDIITGGAAADALTGGAGNDTFVLAVAADSVLAARDVINDFSANTFGNGAAGVAGTGAVTGSAAKFTGDVIDVTAFTVVGVNVTVQANAADAQTYIQNQTGGANLLGAALDSSTGLLYMDLTNDGVIDSVIELTGVTTIDAAAFLIA
jgi:Ca2+-binding RTX toxin-like protein